MENLGLLAHFGQTRRVNAPFLPFCVSNPRARETKTATSGPLVYHTINVVNSDGSKIRRWGEAWSRASLNWKDVNNVDRVEPEPRAAVTREHQVSPVLLQPRYLSPERLRSYLSIRTKHVTL